MNSAGYARRGIRRPLYTPARDKCVELRHKLREVFRCRRSHPVKSVICEANLILAGWIAYFRIGHAGREFASIRDWVEKKVRRHLERAGKRPGFGRKRWSRQRLYQELGLYEDYSLRHLGVGPKALPAR